MANPTSKGHTTVGPKRYSVDHEHALRRLITQRTCNNPNICKRDPTISLYLSLHCAKCNFNLCPPCFYTPLKIFAASHLRSGDHATPLPKINKTICGTCKMRKMVFSCTECNLIICQQCLTNYSKNQNNILNGSELLENNYPPCVPFLDAITQNPMQQFDTEILSQDLWNFIIELLWRIDPLHTNRSFLSELCIVSHPMLQIIKHFICRPQYTPELTPQTKDVNWWRILQSSHAYNVLSPQFGFTSNPPGCGISLPDPPQRSSSYHLVQLFKRNLWITLDRLTDGRFWFRDCIGVDTLADIMLGMGLLKITKWKKDDPKFFHELWRGTVALHLGATCHVVLFVF